MPAHCLKTFRLISVSGCAGRYPGYGLRRVSNLFTLLWDCKKQACPRSAELPTACSNSGTFPLNFVLMVEHADEHMLTNKNGS
jgi:hypothetical protein